MMASKRLRLLAIIISIIISNIVLLSCSKNKADTTVKKDLAYFRDKTAGGVVGSTDEIIIRNIFPNAKISQFQDTAGLLLALQLGKVDYVVGERAGFIEFKKNDPGYQYVDESVGEVTQGIAVTNRYKELIGYDVLSELNEYIHDSIQSGYIKKLEDKWFDINNDDVQYESKTIKNPKATLKISFNLYMPYVYLKNNQFVGIDIEFIESFCEKYNYAYQYDVLDFSAMLASITTGKSDIAIGGITVTDERKQNMLFTDIYLRDKMYVVYYEKNTEKMSPIDILKDGINSTFIKEGRYKLFIDGAIVTIIITMSSIIFGIIFGYVLYLLYSLDFIILKKLIDVYEYIINGTPSVVLVMIFYYIIFKDFSIPGIVISIFAFTMIFGIYIFGALVSYIGVIDNGQYEAGIAIGYSEYQVFTKILLPQAVLNILPGFQAQAIEILKGTAIVGYVAVVDLTKVGDVIRSRTFDAIFPLLSVTVLYFVIGFIFKIIVRYLRKKLNPYLRSQDKVMKEIMK